MSKKKREQSLGQSRPSTKKSASSLAVGKERGLPRLRRDQRIAPRRDLLLAGRDRGGLLPPRGPRHHRRRRRRPGAARPRRLGVDAEGSRQGREGRRREGRRRSRPPREDQRSRPHVPARDGHRPAAHARGRGPHRAPHRARRAAHHERARAKRLGARRDPPDRRADQEGPDLGERLRRAAKRRRRQVREEARAGEARHPAPQQEAQPDRPRPRRRWRR